MLHMRQPDNEFWEVAVAAWMDFANVVHSNSTICHLQSRPEAGLFGRGIKLSGYDAEMASTQRRGGQAHICRMHFAFTCE